MTENEIHSVDSRSDTPTTPTTTDAVTARIGKFVFTGRVVERGYDSEPVVYLRDSRGRERAVRPRRSRHTLQGGGRA